MFNVKIFPLGGLGVNAVAVWDAQTQEGILFDAPEGISLAREGLGVHWRGLFLTHGHFDHIQGVGELGNIPIHAGRGDFSFLSNPKQMGSWMEGAADGLSPVNVSTWLEGGEVLSILGTTLRILPAPGHSPGGVVYYFPKEALAMTGDTLFCQSVGRVDLPGGDGAALRTSLRGLVKTLPDATRLIPGHGPETTMGKEKKNNPWLMRY
jgi:hydroxyacylglutathione hydrolase